MRWEKQIQVTYPCECLDSTMRWIFYAVVRGFSSVAVTSFKLF